MKKSFAMKKSSVEDGRRRDDTGEGKREEVQLGKRAASYLVSRSHVYAPSLCKHTADQRVYTDLRDYGIRLN
jgi:hypothetical protein